MVDRVHRLFRFLKRPWDKGVLGDPPENLTQDDGSVLRQDDLENITV